VAARLMGLLLKMVFKIKMAAHVSLPALGFAGVLWGFARVSRAL
jgi:hypothetical protein